MHGSQVCYVSVHKRRTIPLVGTYVLNNRTLSVIFKFYVCIYILLLELIVECVDSKSYYSHLFFELFCTKVEASFTCYFLAIFDISFLISAISSFKDCI